VNAYNHHNKNNKQTWGWHADEQIGGAAIVLN
jgi:hypothetical protein